MNQPYGRPRRGIGAGCGCIVVLVTLAAIIVVVGLFIAGVASNFKEQEHKPRVEVPDNVPPAAAPAAPNINIHGEGRTSLQLRDWATPLSKDTGIARTALMAYGNAEVIARQTRPGCHVTWNTLAGLGYVETRHGTYDGKTFGAARLDEAGNVTPPIIGPELNGKGFAEVRDTDGGELDGDKQFDRALGPLQFIPESWKRYGVDANGDGVADPQNIDDAAASSVRLLCDDERDMNTPEGWTQAIAAYNLSGEYVRKVRDAAANYAVGQRPLD